MKQLFVRRGKNTAGPLTVAQFKEAVANGKLVGSDQFAEASDGPWYPVAKVPFLPKPSVDTAATHLLADKEKEPGHREQEPEREPQLLPQESQSFQGEGGASQAEQQARFELITNWLTTPVVGRSISGTCCIKIVLALSTRC